MGQVRVRPGRSLSQRPLVVGSKRLLCRLVENLVERARQAAQRAVVLCHQRPQFIDDGPRVHRRGEDVAGVMAFQDAEQVADARDLLPMDGDDGSAVRE